MPGKGSAAADLDVVRMGPDRQYPLLLALPVHAHRFCQQQDLLDEFLGRERPEQNSVDPALHDLPHELRRLEVGDDQGGDPAVLFLDLLEEGEAARKLARIDDHQVEVLCLDEGRGGFGCRCGLEVRDRLALEDMPRLLEGSLVAVDQQDAQRLLGHRPDDAQAGFAVL